MSERSHLLSQIELARHLNETRRVIEDALIVFGSGLPIDSALIAECDRLLQLARRLNTGEHAPQTPRVEPSETQPSQRNRASVQSIVTGLVTDQDGEFTISDMYERVVAIGGYEDTSRNNVNTALWRLVRSGELQKTTDDTYRRIDHQQPSTEGGEEPSHDQKEAARTMPRMPG